MKTWNTPAIEELEINETKFGGTTKTKFDYFWSDSTLHADFAYVSGQPETPVIPNL